MKYVKDPSAVLDYTQDWSARLALGEVIATASVVAKLQQGRSLVDIPVDDTFVLGPAGHSTSHTDTTVTCWIVGGTAHKTYSLTFHIVTSAGREDDWTDEVHIQEL